MLSSFFQASKRSVLSFEPKTQATKAPIKTTTDDTPDFDRGKVSLEIPDPLFGSSFSTVTNVSKIFGDLIMVSFAITLVATCCLVIIILSVLLPTVTGFCLKRSAKLLFCYSGCFDIAVRTTVGELNFNV